MNRRKLLQFTALVLAGTTGLRAFASEKTPRSTTMRPDPKAVARLAQDYTAAWNSKSPEAVASFFAADGEIVINRGEPWTGRARIAEMAAGFFADVPDMALTCDEVRVSGSHAVYVWTFTGHDAKTGNPLNVRGWEEWDLDHDLKIRASRGWYDAEEYAAQVAGG
jgi:uncharacterized protein (TIGR02246 family)